LSTLRKIYHSPDLRLYRVSKDHCTKPLNLSPQCFPVHISLPLFTPISIYVLLTPTCTILSIFIETGFRNNFVIYLGTSCVYRRSNKILLKKTTHVLHQRPYNGTKLQGRKEEGTATVGRSLQLQS